MDQPAPALPGHGADGPSTMPTLAEVLQQMTLDMASQLAEMQAAGEVQPGTAALGSDNVPLRGKSAVPRAHSAPPAAADDATPMDARPVSENWLDQLPRNTAKSAEVVSHLHCVVLIALRGSRASTVMPQDDRYVTDGSPAGQAPGRQTGARAQTWPQSCARACPDRAFSK